MIKYFNITKLIGAIVIVLASSCAIQDHIKETLGVEVEKKLNKNKSAAVEKTNCHSETLLFSEMVQSSFAQNCTVEKKFDFTGFPVEVEKRYCFRPVENLHGVSIPIYISLHRLKIDLV